MRSYKASFAKLDKDSLEKSNKKAILPISVGQLYHEGEKFIATLKAVNNTFYSCTVAVCDTLQRYTRGLLLNENNEELLYKIATFDGDKWIERNFKTIDSILSIPYEIKRWDDWFKTKNYLEYKEQIDQLYKEDSKFKKLVHEAAENFSDKLKLRGHQFDYSQAIECNISYLLEECAMVNLWGNQEKFDCQVYPSNIGEVLQYAKIKYNNKNQFVYINFNRLQEKEISQKEWQKIIDLVPGSIYYVDQKHDVILCNKGQAEAIGIDNPNSVVGKNSLAYVSNKDIIEEHNKQVMNEKKPFVFEEQLLLSNGKKQWMLSHKAPVIEDGEVKGVVGVSIDITKQKKYEKELLKQKKLLQHALDSNKVFLNNISHEIRTPIHIIGAISEALNDDRYSLSQEQLKDLTTLLVSQNERLKKYAENILELAKTAQYVDEYNFKEYDLSHILSYVISEMRFLATHIEFKGIEIKVKLDHMKIKNVISNLINNAIKYGEDKNIIIDMEDQGDYIVVAVKNKGMVPEKELSLMFEPFYQCEKTRTGAGGVGLGLSICKEIIIAHKGYIWAESKDGNVTVFFKLPK